MSIFYVAAHALVVDAANRVLTIKRSQENDYMPLKWDFPGGTVEVGEKVEDALMRELTEEVNISVEVLCPLYVYSNLSQIPVRQTVQIVYLCNYTGGDIRLNPEEHESYRWVDYTELTKLECIPYLESFVQHFKSADDIPLKKRM